MEVSLPTRSACLSVNSGLIFANHGDQSDVLTVNEILNGNTVATSQTITVTDPPISPSDTIAPDPLVSATSEDRSVQSTRYNHLIASSPFTEALNGKGEHSAFLFRTDLDRDRSRSAKQLRANRQEPSVAAPRR